MLFIKSLRRNKEIHKGFSVVELLVALVIVVVIAAIAIPLFLNAKSRQYATVATNDGDQIFREAQAVFNGVQSFGTTNGTISYSNSTKQITITLGNGGDSIPPFFERVSNGTSLTGVTYANSSSWCMDVVNNGTHVFFTQQGFRPGATSCPISGLSYGSTTFTRGTDNQQLVPTNTTGGNGTKTYTITAGTLPPGVTFDTTTGTFSGPISAAWSFKTAQIASGLNYTCVVTTTGGVKCWGNNSVGQLGEGDTVSQSSPVDVSGMTSGFATVITGSSGTTCAISIAGALWCWGNNASGQLGNGTTTNSYVPVQVTGLTSGVASASVGADSVCAVLTSGAVKCWGDNTYGQLGNNSTTASLTPTPVTGFSASGASKISVGGDTACLVTTTGGLKCWGNSTNGQMGTGSNSQSLVPIDVVGLTSGVAEVDEGTLSGCAVTTAGAVKCWGYNSNGQLGDGTTTQRLTPVVVTGASSGISHVGVGDHNVCAMTTSGAAKCWGENKDGELGDGDDNDRHSPDNVTGLSSTITQIAVGNAHACSVTSSQTVACWGADADGEIGDGIVTQRTIPNPVTNLTAAPGQVKSFNQTCALTQQGGIKCWGNNTRGQVGEGDDHNKAAPVDVVGLTTGVQQVSTGENFTCALTTSNGAKCWGSNDDGELGDGNTTASLTAIDVPGLTGNVAQVDAGSKFACAVKNSGTVYCWGDNTYGELGNNSTTRSLTPVQVSGISNATYASAGYGPYACALLSTGAVKCWGSNSNGQLGDGTTTERHTPVTVSSLSSGVASISTGKASTCAVKTDASLFCWGYNANGQLGNGTTTQSLTPVAVPSLGTTVSSVSVGVYHSCAVLTTTGVKPVRL